MEDFRENMKMGVNDYLKSLEAELIKIQVFQRELPLCFELVSQAIEGCRKRMKSENGVVDYFHEEQNQQQLESDDCSDQTSSEGGPVLEEFIPIKKRCSFSDESQINTNNNKIEKSGKKSDWLRSAQLWNQTPDPPLNKEQVVEVKKKCGAFKPFIKDVIKPSFVHEISPSSPIATAAASSSAGTHSAGSRKEDKDRHDPGRKQRRCWSPELHRRFLNALQQLGGAHVATPKQIREFMKVDGLTNDEVKSHLQKYRLHTRRPSPGINNNSNTIQQTPQCVAVGGLWAQPQIEGSRVEQGKNNVVVNFKQNTTSLSEEIRSSRRCTSPQASSSSTHTIAASPIY